MGNGKKPRKYHDLDALMGTWSVAEAAEFDAAIGNFETIEALTSSDEILIPTPV